MARYIDADKLKEMNKNVWIWNDNYTGCQAINMELIMIDKIPTADVVEVVRCNDCRYCTSAIYGMLNDGTECRKMMCEWHNIEVSGDYYCASGERKDNEQIH